MYPNGQDFEQGNYRQSSIPNPSFPSSQPFASPNPDSIAFYSSQLEPGSPGGRIGVDLGPISPLRSTSGTGDLTGPAAWDDEPPLLEELGINFKDIWCKTKSILFWGAITEEMEKNTDLAGPLMFGILLGFLLLLTGKVHFGYIYGFGIVGCLLIYFILNLMSNEGMGIEQTVSILGYCLLPIILLAFVNIFTNLRGTVGLIISLFAIGWCTVTATRFIEKALEMGQQRYLIAYPIFLLYACFSLLTVY